MAPHPRPVLTWDVSAVPALVRLMDRAFIRPPAGVYKLRGGRVKWRPLHTAGAQRFGRRMPFFYSDAQHAACLVPPDRPHADRLEALREGPKGCVMRIGFFDGIEWGTNFTHFTYKWKPRIDECRSVLGELLGSPNARGQVHLFYYPRGTHREWHTNETSRNTGWRAYIVRSQVPGKANFTYMDGDELVVDPDLAYTLRVFRFGGGLDFYHCVVSETDRWSFGLNPMDWTFDTLEEARDAVDARLGPKGARLVLPD